MATLSEQTLNLARVADCYVSFSVTRAAKRDFESRSVSIDSSENWFLVSCLIYMCEDLAVS